MNDSLCFVGGHLNVFFVANDSLSFLNDNLNGFIGSSSGYKRHDKDASQKTKTPAETKDDDKQDSLEKPAEVEVKHATVVVSHNRKGASNTRAKRCLAS